MDEDKKNIEINKKSNNILSNEDLYQKLCELTEKYNLLEKDNEKNKKNILVLNRQLLILRTFIDDYIMRFTQDIENLKANGINNNFDKDIINKEKINDDLKINLKKAEDIVEQKFGPPRYKYKLNFEKLLESIIEKQKNTIEEENLKEFKKLCQNLIELKISPLSIIGNFFHEKVFNKINERRDNIDMENLKRVSILQAEIINAANNIEFQLNITNQQFDKKEKKPEKKEDIKEKKNEEKKVNKKVDIVTEFRNEFQITKEYATDKEIKNLLKANKNDKLKTYNNIMNKFIYTK